MMSTARAAQRQEYADGYRDGRLNLGYFPPGPADDPSAHTYTRGHTNALRMRQTLGGVNPDRHEGTLAFRLNIEGR